jgi:hypothetical protein
MGIKGKITDDLKRTENALANADLQSVPSNAPIANRRERKNKIT